MNKAIRETVDMFAPQAIYTRNPPPKRNPETVQYIRPVVPQYQYDLPQSQFQFDAPTKESTVQQLMPPHETVVSRRQPEQYPGTFSQYMPIPKQPERPGLFLPLDRIHENGHPDITRFTTEEFKVFHDYLTKSTEEGRNFRGSEQIDVEDIPNIQDKILKDFREELVDGRRPNLNTLLALCELSNLRDEKCVDSLTKNGLSDLVIQALVNTVPDTSHGETYVNDQINNPGLYIAFNLLLDAAQRFTENDQELARQMGRDVVPVMLAFIRDPFFDVEALNRDDEELKWMSRRELMKKVLTLLYNCIRNHPGNRGVFRRNTASDLLKPFLDCRFYILRAKALFILAYIVTEEENIDLNTTTLNIEFIVKILRRALEDSSHYSAHYNFFAVEVVEAVQRVAANDDNKDKFIEAGFCFIASMMDWKNSKEERNSALNALWVLSFTKQHKDAIVKEKGFIDNVRACMGIDDFTQTCQAILWNLRDHIVTPPEVILKTTEEDKDDKKDKAVKDDSGSKDGSTPSGSAPPNAESKVTSKSLPHVMISYQWDVQKQIVKVKDILKAHGFNVWLDVERMGGSTLEAMANAVEEACVVIVCFSEKYKDSPACRTEAEYTYKLRKPIVPLKMQTGYDPNGWLGAMLGTKLYIQMNTLDLVQQNMGSLVRELAGRGRTITDEEDEDDEDAYIPARHRLPSFTPSTPTPQQIAGVRPPDLAPYYPSSRYGSPVSFRQRGINGATSLQIVQQWGSQEVAQWLSRNDYSHLQGWFLHYTGEDLVGLKKIAARAPEFFFGKLERDFGFKLLLDMIRFQKMLDDIY